jgi:hypothetical protein
MRKSSTLLVIAFAMVMTMAFPAMATDLNEKSWADVDCGDDVVAYHFVLNKYDVAPQSIDIEFGNGDDVYQIADKVTRGTQHFNVEGFGGIVSIDTSGNGFLVLSDWECTGKKGQPGK